MAYPSYADCSCNYCSSTVSLHFPESQQPSVRAIRYTDDLQNTQTPLPAQQQYSQDTVPSLNALEASTGHTYQKHELSNLDDHSFYQRYLPILSQNGDNPCLDGCVASNNFDVSHPGVQTPEDVSVELHLNPEAPSFTPSPVDSRDELNLEAPSFVRFSFKPGHELDPEAATFVPSTSSRNGLGPETPAFLPAGTVPNSEWIHETQEDFDGEARFFTASQLSPDEFAAAPLLWPFAFHHLNYFGQPVNGKSFTTPAATLAILKSNGKYRAAKYAENLRIRVLQAGASIYLDPLLFVGDFEALWTLEGTELQEAATGACYKLYHPHGEWKADNWDEDDDYPVLDPEDPDKHPPGHIIINGKFNENFFDRGDDIVELNSQYEQFVSRQLETRNRIRARQAAPKSGLRICTTADDLDQEVESFKTRFEAYDKPLQLKWANLSDDEEDELCAATDDSWKSRCLQPQGGQGQQPQSDCPCSIQEEPTHQDQSEGSLLTRGADRRSPREALFTPCLLMISEEDEENQNTISGQLFDPADLPLPSNPEEDEETQNIESGVFFDPADLLVGSGVEMICGEDEEDQNIITGRLSNPVDLPVSSGPVDRGKSPLANDQTIQDTTTAIDSLPNENEIDIIGKLINTFTLRESPRRRQSLRDVYDGTSTPSPMDSTTTSPTDSPTPSSPDSTATVSSIDSTPTGSIDSTSSQPGPSTAITRPKRVRFSYLLKTTTSPPMLSPLQTAPIVTTGSRSLSTTTVEISPLDSSEHLIPTPALPVFSRVRPRQSWYLRPSGWKNFLETRAADPIDPTVAEMVSQGAIIAPSRGATEVLAAIQRRCCLVKKGQIVWEKVRGFLTKKQRLD